MSEFSQVTTVGRPTNDEAPSAKEKATDAAQAGKQAAGEVAHTAVGAAKDVTQETGKQAQDLLGKARAQVREQAGIQQGALVDNLRSLGDQLSAMTDQVDKDGTAVDAVSQVRDRVRDAAEWLDRREPADVLEELRTLGREHPGPFLIGAALAGVLAGRLTRGVVAVHAEAGSDTAPPQLAEPPAQAHTAPVTETPRYASPAPAGRDSMLSGYQPGHQSGGSLAP